MSDGAALPPAAQIGSRLPELIALAQEDSSPKRRALLRELTDCFFGVAERTEAETALYGAVLSDLTDAMETAVRAELAERFAEAPDAPHQLIRRLANDEIERDHADQYEAHSSDPFDYAMPGGESRTALATRLDAWLETLNRSRTHVVVTHSGCLRALRGIYTAASREAILAYREPQTASFLLETGQETMLDIPASVLRALGCDGAGRTVWI